MTSQRMDHVSVVVDNLEAAKAFLIELGMEPQGEAPIEGPWVDRVNGLDDPSTRPERSAGRTKNTTWRI